MDAGKRVPSPSPFGPVHVRFPKPHHDFTHTAILLHGRGSTGEEFAEELLDELHLADGATLPDRLPTWRWVFPTSRQLWSPTFREFVHGWFEVVSLADVDARRDLQAPGIRDAVLRLLDVLQAEVDRLHGRAENVFLGGVSLGGAVGLWTLLAQAGSRGHQYRLGGFVGASTWLPFASSVQRLLAPREEGEDAAAQTDADVVVAAGEEEEEEEEEAADSFARRMLGLVCDAGTGDGARATLRSTPVFLGHGIDDAYVDLTLGERARDVLREAGLTVEWRAYRGADQEGHWIQEPQELDDMAAFLHRMSQA